MLKNILRLLVFISLILAAGQIRVAQKSIGDHYVHSLRDAGQWSVDKVKNSKMMAGVTNGAWLENLKDVKNNVQKKVKDAVPKNIKIPEIPQLSAKAKTEDEEDEIDEKIGSTD